MFRIKRFFDHLDSKMHSSDNDRGDRNTFGKTDNDAFESAIASNTAIVPNLKNYARACKTCSLFFLV